MEDREIQTMSIIAEALAGLEDVEIARVLRWAGDRFGLGNAISGYQQVAKPEGDTNLEAAPGAPYEAYHDLIDIADPQSGLERILVTSYWFQVVEGQDSFDSYRINRELKNLGYPAGNITRDLSALIKHRFVLQVRKEGTTKQARKKYRLTREGIRRVDDLIKG